MLLLVVFLSMERLSASAPGQRNLVDIQGLLEDVTTVVRRRCDAAPLMEDQPKTTASTLQLDCLRARERPDPQHIALVCAYWQFAKSVHDSIHPSRTAEHVLPLSSQ